MRFLLRTIARLLFRVRVVGDLAPFGHADRLLLVANHHSRFDAVFLALFLPREPVIVVPPEETRSRWMRWLLGYVPHEVHDLNNPLSMKPLLRLLRGGRPVVLFPEGRIARNAAENKVRHQVVFGFSYRTAPRLMEFLKKHRAEIRDMLMRSDPQSRMTG